MRGLGVLLFAIVVVIAANTLLGGSVEGVYGFGRSTAWLITIAVFASLFAYVGYALKQRLDGIFIDDRNRISLARFQLVLWTLLLVSALMSVGLFNAAVNDTAPLAIKVPPEVWALLGIGAFSFVTAPVLVDSRKKDPPPEQKVQDKVQETVKAEDKLTTPPAVGNNVPAKAAAAEARWMDLVRGDTTAGYAHIDISKVQQLAFTVLLIAIYGASILDKMTFDPVAKAIKEFPPVDSGFVAMLGLSHATYLVYKKTAT